MPLLSGPRQLQAGQLRRGEAIQRFAARARTEQLAGLQLAADGRRQGRQGGARGRGHRKRSCGRGGRGWGFLDAERQGKVIRGGSR